MSVRFHLLCMVARCLFIESTPSVGLDFATLTLAALCLATLSRHRGNISLLRWLVKSSQTPNLPSNSQRLCRCSQKCFWHCRHSLWLVAHCHWVSATSIARWSFPKEVSSRRLIEGNFHPGETVVVMTFSLVVKVQWKVPKLESAGLNVHDIVVFMDHGQGVKDRLQENGYRAHAVLTISEITETLYQAGVLRSSSEL